MELACIQPACIQPRQAADRQAADSRACVAYIYIYIYIYRTCSRLRPLRGKAVCALTVARVV
jgi:hypothetical protein